VKKNIKFIISVYSLSVSFVCSSAIAGSVEKITGAKVIFNFDGESAPSPGDKYFILDNSSNKEIGLFQVLKIKGNRALGKLLKGRGKAGDSTELAQQRTPPDRRSKNESSAMVRPNPRVEAQGSRQMFYGFGADFIMTSRYLNLASVGAGSFAGNAIGYRFVVDYPIKPPWVLLGSVGIHPFSVSGTATLDSEAFNYKETASYIAVEALARYLLEGRTEGLWVGGGLGLYLPSSFSSTISTEKSKTEVTPIGSAGYNMRLGRKFTTFKVDVVNFPSKSSGMDFSKQTFQLVLGAIYFL
jgi:hypothetical protein